MPSVLEYDLRVHIGLPKTASTSIQATLLQGPCPAYLGKSFVHPHLRHLFRQLIPYADNSTWLHEINVGMVALEDVLASLNLPSSQAIVSDELLSGFDINNFFLEQRPDALLMLSRIKQIFRSVKVLVVFRNQSAFFKSYYNYLIGLDYNLCYQIFIEEILNQKSELGQLLYLANWFTQLESLELKLTVIPFEALVQLEPSVMEFLSEFFLLPLTTLPHFNPSASQEAIWQRFQLNLAKSDGRYRLSRPIDHFRSLQRVNQLSALGSQALYVLDPATEEELKQVLGRENRKLAARLPWDLEKYGYCLE